MAQRSIPQFLGSAYQIKQMLPLKQQVVLFLGRSNAGKSSLLNALMGQNLAKVAKTPGKTRSINYYRYGKKLCLVDFPGYGYAKRSHQERDEWKLLVKAFFDSLPKGALAFLLLDSQRKLEEEEIQLIESLKDFQYQVVLILTKVDRLNQSERQLSLRNLEKQLAAEGLENLLTFRWISVKSREGLSSLQKDLYRYEKESSLPAPPDATQGYS